MNARRWALVAVISSVILAVISPVSYWLYLHIAPRTASVADRAGNYTAEISADGGNGNSVRMAFSRPSHVFGTVTIVIPSGTVIYSHNVNGRRLITATPVNVVLSNDTPSVAVLVPTYRINEFAATPSDGEALEFAGATAETEPLRKLSDCMKTSSLPVADKQLIVWTVAQDLLQKTPDEALEFLTDKISRRMVDDRGRGLQNNKPEMFAKAPLLTGQHINELIEKEIEDGMSEFNASAAAQAKKQLDSLSDDDQDMLASCGYLTEDMPLFQ
jgi:hypothetical protein